MLFAVMSRLLVWGWAYMTSMPGHSHRGPLPPMTAGQEELAVELRRDVEQLATRIGERHVLRHSAYVEAADFIESSLTDAGYTVNRQPFEVNSRTCVNLEVELTGRDQAAHIVIIGAHYDTVAGSSGANDNATGVAGLLALARRFADRPPQRTLRFVAFANEEPPFFQTPRMGSWVYSRRCRDRKERIDAMISFDGLGFYSDEADSQQYPRPFSLVYPKQGNFIGVAGNLESRPLVRRVVAVFRAHAAFPSEGAALPGWIEGVGWSDHWSFWQHGVPAVMVSDTLPFRYAHYHEHSDTLDKLDFSRMARVVAGFEAVTADLAGLE